MARKKKLDFTNVESFAKAAEGRHRVKIVEINEQTSQGGDDMLVFVFEVIKGDSKGARVYENCVLTDKALWKLQQILQAIGIKCDGKVALDLDKLIGKICEIDVFHEEYEGRTRARIGEFFKATSAKSNDDEDVDDEDDIDDDDEEEEEPAPKKSKKQPAKGKSKKKPEPDPEEDEDEDDEDEDFDDDEEDEEEEVKPAKKSSKKSTKKPAPKKSAKKKQPEFEEDDDDDDWDDDDDE